MLVILLDGVEDNVRQLRSDGLIEVNPMPMPEGYNDRFDYILTEKRKREQSWKKYYQ